MGEEERKKTDNKVIHVLFGKGGGRIKPPSEAATPTPAGAATSTDNDASSSAKEPVTDTFAAAEVAKLLGLTVGRLKSLDKAGIVVPSGQRKGRRAYTFSDVIALRAARDLLKRKVRLKEVAVAVQKLRETLPKVTRPLAELRIVSDGNRVVVKSATGAFEPATGQMVIDFDVSSLRDDVVRVLRPRVGQERARSAYELYLQASELDEDPATMDEAEALYRKAVELDPYLAIAYTNLGNICFRKRDDAQAEAHYREALALDQAQPEAKYNLGYVMLERGDPAQAVEFFRGAIEADATFADAYFNLAMAYEELGDANRARPCWRRYLELEPTGTWADIARKHL